MHPDSLSGGAQSLPRSHPLGAPALCASLRAFCPSIVLLLSFSPQHLSDALRDLVTLTFEVMALVGDVGLTLPFHLCTKIEVCSLPLQIWHTFGLSISRPGDLDLWSLTLKLLYPLFPVGWATFLPILCFCDFFSRLMGQHLSDARDLDFWLWRSWRLSMMRVFVFHLKFEVRKPSRSEDIAHLEFCHLPR